MVDHLIQIDYLNNLNNLFKLNNLQCDMVKCERKKLTYQCNIVKSVSFNIVNSRNINQLNLYGILFEC